jgi:hypothetical protein
MSLGHGAKIVTNGLVFAYDMGPNPGVNKSWKGAPTTNLYADGDFSAQALHPVRSGTWSIVDDPRNNAKKVLKATPSASNQYHGRDIPVTTSSVYSLQMEIYVSSDFNGTNVQMYPEQGGGGANRSYNLANKGTWQLLKFDGKAATTGNIRMLAYVLSSFTTGYVLISNVQVELSSFATPFVNGTRSNTQSLLDWTGNNTITANSLTYNSDGSFSFTSASNYASIGYNPEIDLVNTVTLEAWLKYTTSSNRVCIEKSSNNSHYQFQIFASHQGAFIGGDIVFMLQPNSSNWVTAGLALNNNQWHHVVGTYDRTTTTARIYVDGALRNTNGAIATGPTTNTQPLLIGSRSGTAGLGGTIGVAKIYNRALTAAEVTQNFNALRGRYGI